MSILGLVISLAARLMAWWRYRKYVQIAYTLYLVVLGIWGIGTLASEAYGLVERRLS